MKNRNNIKGRFAPSPSGRMHLGNIYAALMSWLSAKSKNGTWLLRIEDLDPQRSKYEYARMIEDDLAWLGLEWDEGGLDGKGQNGPYLQSLRNDIYYAVYERLRDRGLTYPCYCTRADIMAAQAPHESDGRIIYRGTCRYQLPRPDVRSSTRLIVPDTEVIFTDRYFGQQTVNLTNHCGDFIIRRADGAWAYQLAVVVDDAAMEVTEVVRGHDLLLSTAQQIYLYELLGVEVPEFAHLPLICNADGQRLSKRDASLSMECLRDKYKPEEIIGKIALYAGLTDDFTPCRAEDLTNLFESRFHPKNASIKEAAE